MQYFFAFYSGNQEYTKHTFSDHLEFTLILEYFESILLKLISLKKILNKNWEKIYIKNGTHLPPKHPRLGLSYVIFDHESKNLEKKKQKEI